MGQDFRASIGELPTLIQRKDACRHLAQIELPRSVPMICFSKFERSGAGLKFGKGQDVINGTVWWPGKYAWVEFDLGLMVPDFLHTANAMGPIRRI